MLLPTMEEITMEVIGRPAADGRNQIKPALVKTHNDQAGEIKNLRTKWTDQAQLYEEKQQRMMQLRTIIDSAAQAQTGSGEDWQGRHCRQAC